MMQVKRIALTPGEPAGIGPELVIQLAQKSHPCELVVLADPELLRQRAKQIGLPIELNIFNELAEPRPQIAGSICVLPIELATEAKPGVLNKLNAPYVLNCLEKAITGCEQNIFHAMVTGPVNKGIINDSGTTFSGHTEFLAEKTATPQVVMMLATEGLRIALVTTHLALCDVPAAITKDVLNDVIDILFTDLENKFSIKKPCVFVCGLNPHAGENGHLGREEIDVIIPVLQAQRAKGRDLIGPLAADTLFSPKNLQRADAVLAMYHDQGLPVLKYKGFGNAINITLGLPILRTSVDHGTALELAGSGTADAGSFEAAIATALAMSP